MIKDNEQKSQQERILKALLLGKRVSSMWGFRKGIVRLTNRISELVQQGYDIKDEWITKNGKRYKEYYINNESA